MQNSFAPEGCLSGTRENTEFIRSEAGLRLAKETGKILESTVICCDRELNLTVALGNTVGVIPKEEAVYNPDGSAVKDIAVITRVGKPVCFKVKDIICRDGVRKALLSRAEAQKDCIDGYLSYLLPGDVIPCRVTHTEKFGAFVDVGCGVPALLPIDCISVSRISHASDRLRTSMTLRCVVRNKEDDPFRMFVTLKELLGSWEENAAGFSAGQTVRGIVRGTEPYGVFIELTPNLSGLSEYRDDLKQGDEVAVYIKNTDKRKMKVKLVVVGSLEKTGLSELKYYTGSDVTHIYRWLYSPPCAEKTVETVFE
ncbi:MAG: S1 RNA-binding domain-containing protein [Clostridia bacterium]|nr:S1 RNA-binding domain-containing protein [Clostridia bacterium]